MFGVNIYAKDNSKLKRSIILRSIASYSGVCACPYSRMRNGRKCGKRSAWSKPGGASPICYETDITKEMLGSN